MEQKLAHPIYIEAKDKQFTVYVHNGGKSERVSDKINSLSGDLKANLSHLATLKTMNKKVQGAYGRAKLQFITSAVAFYAHLVQVATAKGLQPETDTLQETRTAIRQIPKQRVNKLTQLRHQRNALIQ